MAGLNNLISDSQTTQTTLPAWYDTAQQNVVTQGNQAYAAAPQLGQTTAQGAINTLQGPANPFTQAQGTLQQISSGAANPWITDASGKITPNTSTAMGGLFAAQRDQLNQLLPNYTAPVEGANIGSGNFGSLRGQTAVDKAKADAFANLNAQQLQAALTNQQTGVQGAAQLGNVGQQGINAAMNVGTAQQNAPFQNIGNLASLLGTINAPTTVTSQRQLSPLSQAATLANTLTGSGGSGILQALVGKGGLSSLTGSGGILGALAGGLGLNSLYKSLTGGSDTSATGSPQGNYDLQGGGTLTINPDGSQYIKNPDGTGTYYDPQGNPSTGPTYDPNNPPPTIDASVPTDLTGGGYNDTTGESAGS
jgi:hypothetical protein